MEQLEIERRYLIRMPGTALLSRLPSSRIEQVYILSPEGGRERIRRREHGGRAVCTHTVKQRLSELTRIEREEEISEERYSELLSRADPARRTILKTRFIYDYDDQPFEIDVFPFWDDRALMELELHDETQTLRLPPDIGIVREVTFDSRYTNSAIAREIPWEPI